MANNYYDATGVLVLDKITPMITALFGPFNLNAAYPGNGLAYIARISEDNNTSWDSVLDGLRDLVAQIGLKLPDDAEDTVDEHLYLLSEHFGTDRNESLGNLIEHSNFEDDADPGILFEIAKHFDDGHGLKAIKLEGCWHCDKPRLFEFGGNGEYYGRNFVVCDSSNSIVSLGEDIDAALEEGDLDKGADRILQEINSLLAGVENTDVRKTMCSMLSEHLQIEDKTEADLKYLADGLFAADLFFQELLDSVETLTGIADEHGPRTLADLMYLQHAILKNGFIDHYPDESKVLAIASALPSGKRWAQFIKVEYLASPASQP